MLGLSGCTCTKQGCRLEQTLKDCTSGCRKQNTKKETKSNNKLKRLDYSDNARSTGPLKKKTTLIR